MFSKIPKLINTLQPQELRRTNLNRNCPGLLRQGTTFRYGGYPARGTMRQDTVMREKRLPASRWLDFWTNHKGIQGYKKGLAGLRPPESDTAPPIATISKRHNWHGEDTKSGLDARAVMGNPLMRSYKTVRNRNVRECN
jgi:hypothetical protein